MDKNKSVFSMIGALFLDCFLIITTHTKLGRIKELTVNIYFVILKIIKEKLNYLTISFIGV